MLLSPASSKIVKEPLGVIAILGSWNFPYLTVLHPLISAIAAGNCAVVKPSEMCGYSSTKLKQLFARYLDRECFQVVLGQVQVAIRMTSVAGIDKIIFTGSTEKGKLVAAAAAKNLTPCILELGGKSPAIIDRNCNLEFAAQKIAFSAFFNCGQVCIRPDYLLVDSAVTP